LAAIRRLTKPVRRRHHHARRRRALDRHRHDGLVSELPTERFELDAASRRALGLYAGTPEAPPAPESSSMHDARPAPESRFGDPGLLAGASCLPDLPAEAFRAAVAHGTDTSPAGSTELVSWDSLPAVDDPTAPNALDEVAWATSTHVGATRSPADRLPAPLLPSAADPEEGVVTATVLEPLAGREGFGELESPQS
jgi:hypothetical protein